ncbi:uncharacterized protein BP5553_01877 [Venustampulla echinocandica]|uniref:DUF7707 domain-containing protein n=1 Tax=Venustampulla echinocandica TaxID=2656787 RepID=A0A370U293_9HELO|nr:uncharacterized protein BP5553_01877 [Venustampulla echinocandica]RDL41898.1 hypothetical protein BP5553_01877 [Venustampulla echinocandica]
MLVNSAVVVALLASFGAAVTTDNSTIDASTVAPTTRSQWCGGQQNTCPVLCGAQGVTSNDCDVDTLKFKCTCKNGSAPGLQYYTSTMPTFICEQVHENCIVAGQNNAAAQKLCNDAEKSNCGKLDPSKFTEPASTSSSSPSATATGAGTSASDAAPSSTSKAAAATMAVMAREYGTGLLAAGAAAAFGLML